MMGTAAATARQKIDPGTREKINTFYLARLLLISLVLISTTFLKQEVLGATAIFQIYIALAASFLIAVVNVSFWEETLKINYFMPSQLLYDLLLTSYLIYLTGVNDSIFLFLYLLNIVFAAVVYQLNGALLVATASGATFFFIYFANTDMDNPANWYDLAWHELLFLLTALLCGQFMDELKKQRSMLDSQRENIASLERLNERLLNSVPIGIIHIDSDEYVKKLNLTSLGILKLSRAPEMKLKYYELLPELRGILHAWPQMTEQQRLKFLFKRNPAEPESLSLQVVQLPGGDSEGIQHILVIQDVSKVLQLEKKLEFETKLAATGALAAGIAHEIRNPLASISGSIELLSQHLNTTTDQDKKLMSIALREIRRLNSLIKDFLEFAKPKENNPEEFELSAVIQEVAEALASLPSGKRLTVSSQVPAILQISADRERIKQVFFNLFLNSIEASEKQEVHVEISYEWSEQGNLVLNVHDNGPGVPDQLKGKIFDPFYTTKEEGTGLGLSTVAQILSNYGGTVQLAPSADGANFRISLPHARVATAPLKEIS